jgi:hippurate hydrolase
VGKAIAFRSDADALPITERSDKDYASTHPGNMHACGHDGHMAMALELARRLSRKQKLSRDVLIVFQPAEETTGGARDLCDTGIFTLYNVEAIFGMHLWPGVEAGAVLSRCCEMMSRSCELTVTVQGRSAHIAKSWEGIDAMAAGVEFYRQVRLLEQSLPDSVFRVLNFGKFQSGTVRNAVSGQTLLEGSLRAFQDEHFFYLRDKIYEIAARVEKQTGCQVQVHMNDGYPAVLNPEDLYRKVRSLVEFRELEAPSMITEDFSWYQRCLPGMFFFLGTGDSPALHSDNFDFPEEILEKGAVFFEKIAEAWT